MKKKLIALALCMVCIAAFCAPAYAASQTITDGKNNVSYTLSYEGSYERPASGDMCFVSIESASITARKGQSPSGSVTRKVKIFNLDPYIDTFDISGGGADADCTKTYTASFTRGRLSNWDATHGNTTTVTLTRKAESSHTWGSKWSMVSGSSTKHERSCTHPVCVQTNVCEAAWTDCTSNGDGTHAFTCAEGHKVTVSCSGGEATCVAKATCKDCGESYGSTNPDNHKEKTAATCVAKATCELCGNEYGSVNTENHLPGTEATCTTDQVCTREGCGKMLVEALGHDESGADATCTTDKVCAREGCDFVLVEALGHDESGADATCTTAKICAREGCGKVLVEALGHELKETEKEAATCTENGYIDYICTREGCGETVHKKLKASGHWYGLWTPNEDGTHSAACKREDCKHTGKQDCAAWEVTETKDEIATILTVCPVCGKFGEASFEAIAEAKIACEKLPSGEAIVRGMEAPFEGVLYAFTAGYEYGGQMQEFKNEKNGEILPITITLPLDEAISEFTLVRVDVTPETDEAERTEVWNEIAYTFENGVLSFETETDGLFLLLPAVAEEA